MIRCRVGNRYGELFGIVPSTGYALIQDDDGKIFSIEPDQVKLVTSWETDYDDLDLDSGQIVDVISDLAIALEARLDCAECDGAGKIEPGVSCNCVVNATDTLDMHKAIIDQVRDVYLKKATGRDPVEIGEGFAKVARDALHQAGMPWKYDLYEDTKAAMCKFWKSKAYDKVLCAFCRLPVPDPHAHHAILSQRYKQAHNDIRNIVPLHRWCHEQVHAGENGQVIRHLASRLGNGDLDKGKDILAQAETDWGLKTPIDSLRVLDSE